MSESNLAIPQLWTDWQSQDLIEVLPAAVYVCNEAAVVVAYNRRAAELWGRSPEPGDTDEKYCGSHRLYRVDGTFMPHHQTPMEWVLRTGQPARDKEVIIERPDGSRISVLVNIAPLFADDGRLVGAVNCFQDLTVQKRAELERARLVEDLHQAKKMEALGQLTAGIAHDFNNLLTVMLANLELLRERMGDETAQRFLHNAARAAQRGTELNRRLLAFARKEMRPPDAVDLGHVIAGMGELLATSAGDTIRVDIRCQRDVWPVKVDPNQIELAVLNLVINARDAMPSGGVLTIETRNATLAAGDRTDDLSPGDYVILSVSDTGTGMSEEVRRRALEPFFTTKAVSAGSGLGLSVVSGVAAQAGGTTRITTRVGEGTSVEIHLPRAGAGIAPENMEEATPPDLRVGGSEVVLVVDDDSDVREVSVDMLDALGYGAISAASADAALGVLAGEQRVDVMLIDIAMPKMNGVEAAQRARKLRPNLPILFTSGYTDFARFGVDSVERNRIIHKPYRKRDLLAKIHAALRHHALPPPKGGEEVTP